MAWFGEKEGRYRPTVKLKPDYAKRMDFTAPGRCLGAGF